MKKYFALSILLCSILITSCCFRGRDDKTVLLPSAITDALPYSDGQEVVFLSNTGDTLRTTVRFSSQMEPDNCAECFCKSTTWEIRSYTFLEGSANQVANIYADGSSGTGSGYGTDKIEFFIGNGYFNLPVSSSGAFLCDTTLVSKITCHDSLIIQNQTHRNVFALEAPNAPDTATFRILYNAEKGLLRMEKKDGSFWEVL